MLMDLSGALGAEHQRDLRRAADAHRASTAIDGSSRFREFLARGLLGPVDNYRAR